MSDRLAALMTHFPVRARLFNAGVVCGTSRLDSDGVHGHLHLVRSGVVRVSQGRRRLKIDQPSVLLYPRPMAHRFSTDPAHGADLVCARLRFQGGADNPIAAALPEMVCLPLAQVAGAAPVLSLLFEEAFEQRCGRLALIERLFEVVMIQLLRQLMESGEVRGGMLSGLSHPRLRHALVALHESPQRAWTLGTLAAAAGMSRSVFAATFRETVGVTPGQYLQGWRIGLVQQALHSGQPLKLIAAEVGYGSEAALSRAFKALTGLTPRAWKLAQRVA